MSNWLTGLKIGDTVATVRRRRELARLAELPDGKVWETAKLKGWGCSLNYFRRTDEGHEFVGWYPVPPRPGDLIEHPLNSGGSARFKILEVRTVRDPDDMFYALTPHFGRVVQTGTAATQQEAL